MKFARFEVSNEISYGIVDNGEIIQINNNQF